MSDETNRFNRLDEPQKRGQASEAIIKAELVVRDVPVLVPEYDNEPYDLAIEVDGEFYRLQCKTAYGGPDTVQFETVSTRRTASGYERRAYHGDSDLFAVYNPVVDDVYLVPVEDAAAGKMEIRLTPPANNQSVGINWHEEYLIDARLDNL
ncbi:group I intron-associated PD-(D/E)XK endonuclease [Haloglomus salinum]|jgi:hypothetical protein|uniref:group I intron-associated PD-(D/E)XK endonuclease n=1 Tax=Haloglomus salinum TaxID=2962673 RepID=UPI0020C9D59E|nr:group I intron-associated PD-(D/E)XK endonuclease [Haloglomus salinum]